MSIVSALTVLLSCWSLPTSSWVVGTGIFFLWRGGGGGGGGGGGEEMVRKDRARQTDLKLTSCTK